MKSELERINPDVSSSMSLMINPQLSDFFFWHFHPEYELVYISGAHGTRHVGDHISSYKGSDLVLIGSDIPHLNFDYGVKSEYEKVVLHLRPGFLSGNLGDSPEAKAIGQLLKDSHYGLAFGEKVKDSVGKRLFRLQHLRGFERWIEVLRILQILASTSDYQRLHARPYKNRHTKRDQNRLQLIYSFVNEAYHRKITISEAAQVCHMTNEAFCRYFKKMTKLTFTQFVNQHRIDIAKKLLLQKESISAVCYECGFESLSYFNRTFKSVTLESPSSFRRRVTSSY